MGVLGESQLHLSVIKNMRVRISVLLCARLQLYLLTRTNKSQGIWICVPGRVRIPYIGIVPVDANIKGGFDGPRLSK